METLSTNSRGDTKQKEENDSRQIEYLYRQVGNIINELVKLEREEKGLVSKKRDMINGLAEVFEKLYRAGAYTQPVNTICSHICKLARENGLLASERWIHEVIDERFKQGQFSPVKEGEGEQQQPEVLQPETDAYRYSIENSLEEPETTSVETDPFTLKKIIQKSIDEMNPDELRIATEYQLKHAKQLKDAAREESRRGEVLLEKCDEKKIAIDPEVRGAEQIPVESATSTDSGPSEFSKALKEYSDIIYRAHEKVEKYRPPPHLDKKFAKAIEEMILVWRPWIDEKFRKDSFSWLYVAMDEAAHGKHAAATMHSTILPDGTKRALTREQVGDKKEMVNQQAMRILSVWKDLAAMHRWNYELQEKAIAARAKRLHKRLSNSA